jgi:hypothetical protein
MRLIDIAAVAILWIVGLWFCDYLYNKRGWSEGKTLVVFAPALIGFTALITYLAGWWV